jgi:5-methylcytosine-specific restriction endonuclease McrA
LKKKYFSEEEKKAAKALWDREYRLRKAEQIKERKSNYYFSNKDRISSKASQKYFENPEAAKNRAKAWKKNNKEKHNAGCMLRHTRKLLACPSWLSPDDLWMIEEAYHISRVRSEETGIDWHVDHIVPLQGKTVCGLHVPWNLQVITARENCSKKNSFI